MRSKTERYPDFSAELEYLRNNPVSVNIIQKIIQKHALNRAYNLALHERYEALKEAVPIFQRIPRFDEENPINNKINHDFFSEIVDFKTGYFAGKPISYGYSSTEEAEEATGGENGVDEATKAVTDFITRNNTFDVDMECTKNAAICGYSGRLFYHDTDGNERVMAIPGYETIVLSEGSLSEPEFAIRYYSTLDLNGAEVWKVEFYDSETIYKYEGQTNALRPVNADKNLYDFCPLQIIPNNDEMQGDAEKVLALIDGYDTAVSDAGNDLENFANSYMVYENVDISDEEIKKAAQSGAIKFFTDPTATGKVYFLTKNLNDAAIEHYLDRVEDNIYRFSKTPNLGDESFGTSSGVALKFKILSLEAKCGMFQAKYQTANMYMFKLLASSWAKKRIMCDPLQCTADYHRNFPLDLLSEAQTAQALRAAGLPDEVVYSQLSFVDDVDYVMGLIEQQKDSIPPLTEITPDDEPDNEVTEDADT